MCLLRLDEVFIDKKTIKTFRTDTIIQEKAKKETPSIIVHKISIDEDGL